jgi:hypothetical protein
MFAPCRSHHRLVTLSQEVCHTRSTREERTHDDDASFAVVMYPFKASLLSEFWRAKESLSLDAPTPVLSIQHSAITIQQFLQAHHFTLTTRRLTFTHERFVLRQPPGRFFATS